MPNTTEAASSSWYLDPLVAAQKREVHLELMRGWSNPSPTARLLKTDLFEEANGNDHILFDIEPAPRRRFGIDLDISTVQCAARRFEQPGAGLFCCDAKHLAIATGSLDAIVSTSTLDHLASTDELRDALTELARVLRPGGKMVVTLDNPRNPLYWLLRLLSSWGCMPFRLGVTVSRSRLIRMLQQTGLEVLDSRMLIHNPRLVSTVLFLALRRLLGRRADRPIAFLLRAFAALDRLPTREFTGCFSAVRARKPVPAMGAR
ncbi:MAG: class I SAM-dependent methyltransferase [Bryobacteraceae bacterium]